MTFLICVLMDHELTHHGNTQEEHKSFANFYFEYVDAYHVCLMLMIL